MFITSTYELTFEYIQFVSIVQTSQPSLDTFQGLINKNATIFHQARTAKVLQTHWLLMKQYHLLPDQSGMKTCYSINVYTLIHLGLV